MPSSSHQRGAQSSLNLSIVMPNNTFKQRPFKVIISPATEEELAEARSQSREKGQSYLQNGMTTHCASGFPNSFKVSHGYPHMAANQRANITELPKRRPENPHGVPYGQQQQMGQQMMPVYQWPQWPQYGPGTFQGMPMNSLPPNPQNTMAMGSLATPTAAAPPPALDGQQLTTPTPVTTAKAANSAATTAPPQKTQPVVPPRRTVIQGGSQDETMDLDPLAMVKVEENTGEVTICD